ncbi:ATP-binding protein [Actinoallomurus sp. NPDC050550]|uniref:ATP-binding protein n=1 Tax=Actinoallomurus sp. NPDC050550 TaxID=3154937 RepID=UPI0033E4440A
MGAMIVLGTLTLPGSERCVVHARRFVRDLMGEAHPAVDDAELCTSELVTNAVVHTKSGRGGHVTITVARDGDLVEICVGDDGAGGEVPHVRDEPFAEDGRGMVIVTALAAEWGVEAERGGTTTWFRLRS